ncbi:MAG: hypothetical protein AVDCRST_MAG93-5653 [uncultured Chloroflexia bacterium]|uniref:Uncharacterized protein n=1 Tax=uncultured Chloroflexia bacterium TaxID=1672391 RepID=A0A6J4L1N2_9CHLR|nr:MAG: hypothetical protein AVDCRST_MAG93-5653 [uncultured Chloroflexia bacterium]
MLEHNEQKAIEALENVRDALYSLAVAQDTRNDLLREQNRTLESIAAHIETLTYES